VWVRGREIGQSVRVQDSVAIDPRCLSGGTSRGDRSPIRYAVATARLPARVGYRTTGA
jgi:hypothetical protein